MIMDDVMYSVRGFVVRHFVAILVTIAIVNFALLITPGVMMWKYNRERAAYQVVIDALQNKIVAEKLVTQKHDERAAVLEAEMVKLREERVQLDRDLARIALIRSTEKTRHEKSTSDFDAIRDYAELRKLDCERGARLGYPCPDAK